MIRSRLGCAPLSMRASLLLILVTAASASAQPPGEPVERAPRWYDTLEVERPRYARVTTGERMALAAFAALSLPVGLVVGGTLMVPPSVSVMHDRGERYIGIAMGSGFGVGGDTMQLAWWPTARAQWEVAYQFQRERPISLRLSLLADHRFTSTDRRGFFWFGVAGGAGALTDFDRVVPYAEGWIGVMNPMGIRHLPLFPMHHYGVRLRAGYDPSSAESWYEAALTASSTFTFPF